MMTKIILSKRSMTQIHLEFDKKKLLSVEVPQLNSSMVDGQIGEICGEF
jgi:hypothetical protein